MLGDFYRNGRFGLTEDFTAAAAQYQLAAAQNDADAQYDLAFMYEMGWVEENDAEALRLYKLAAAQGLSIAMTSIGGCYRNGVGVAKDRAEAIRWYERAHAAGCISAADDLEEYLEELDDDDDDDDDEHDDDSGIY